jgi:hypothetical protein
MKNTFFIILVVTLLSCSKSEDCDISKHYKLINQAELLICDGNFQEATNTYHLAFKEIEKPFGKDVFNAALASHLSNQPTLRNQYLQTIINNSDDLDFVQSAFVNTYISESDWQDLINKREVHYDPELRQEFKEIHERDQLFRPMYDTHDDTINANRKINVERILALTDSLGFPSHMELGYADDLRGQMHDIVLHHTAQRRSYDKSVVDLEPILFKAVNTGRFDPETAIFYLNFQNDLEKGKFEVYPTWEFKHYSLPDSLNNKVWLTKLDNQQMIDANNKRAEWGANSLEAIATKAIFVAKSNLPFIFTSVRKSIMALDESLDMESALMQYHAFSQQMEEYKENDLGVKG